ncbi:hypothetical protein [Aureimonas pseudogalii]|uniref:Uncharacterized protein n=1 Tax=Aureimonas pseudogalii TaxID=1744844 RepID=A0A7W6H4H0_9HYPH|nr:hypothetical protein [Aureimonas pseudogalii]MBB3998402.1 hypothetical protein [Aureimonas pseudogalii]
MHITKVVGGLRYDTAKAEEICRLSKGRPGDWSTEETALYRTSKGAFFLAGEGGARSRWGKRVSDGLTGGEGLIPVTVEEARDFAEENADAETVEAFFEVEEA